MDNDFGIPKSFFFLEKKERKKKKKVKLFWNFKITLLEL